MKAKTGPQSVFDCINCSGGTMDEHGAHTLCGLCLLAAVQYDAPLAVPAAA